MDVVAVQDEEVTSQGLIYLGILLLGPFLGIPCSILFYRAVRACLTKRKKGKWFSHQHEDVVQEPLRDRFKLYLTTSQGGHRWMLFQIFLVVFASAVLVAEFYVCGQGGCQSLPIWIVACEIFYTIFFAIDYFLYFYAASDRLAHFRNPFNLVDLLTILPVFALLPAFRGPVQVMMGTKVSGNVARRLLRALRAVRALRIIRAYRVLNMTTAGMRRQVAMVAFSLVSMIFIFASIMLIVELEFFEGEPAVTTFHISVYWIIVTTSTVGYGDINPSSDTSRLVMMVFISISWFAMSITLASLITLIGEANNYGGAVRWSEERRHVVIAGIVTHDGLTHMLRELFSPTIGAQHVHVVVLLRSMPSPELVALARNPLYEHKLQLMIGSPLFDRDLKRCKMRRAAACFLLTDKYAPDSDALDATIILQALAVVEYAPEIRFNLYVQIVRRNAKHHLRVAGIPNIVSVDELKYGLLGQGCVAPGLSTLITNLVRSFSTRTTAGELAALLAQLTAQKVSRIVPYHIEDNTKDPCYTRWLQEYRHGCTFQLHSEMLGPFVGTALGELTLSVYLTNGACLFAIETWEDGRRRIVVNPETDRTILNDDVGYFIAPDEAANIISLSDAQVKMGQAAFAHGLDEKRRYEAQPDDLNGLGRAADTLRDDPDDGNMDKEQVDMVHCGDVELDSMGTPSASSDDAESLTSETSELEPKRYVAHQVLEKEATLSVPYATTVRSNDDARRSRAITEDVSVPAPLAKPDRSRSQTMAVSFAPNTETVARSAPASMARRMSTRAPGSLAAILLDEQMEEDEERILQRQEDTIHAVEMETERPSLLSLFSQSDSDDDDGDDDIKVTAPIAPRGRNLSDVVAHHVTGGSSQTGNKKKSEGRAAGDSKRSGRGKHLSFGVMSPGRRKEQLSQERKRLIIARMRRTMLTGDREEQQAFDSSEDGLSDGTELRNHVLIVVLGAPTEDIVDVVAPLRTPQLREHRPIVVLFERDPSEEHWKVIRKRKFTNIQFIQGNPFLHLGHGSINTAGKVLVLNSAVRASQAFRGAFDASIVIISRSIESSHPNLSILSELSEGSSIRYLGTQRQNTDADPAAKIAVTRSSLFTVGDLESLPAEYLFRSRFAAGRVFAASMLDSLTCQAFLNPAVLALSRLMLNSSHTSPKVFQVVVPEGMADCPMSELFVHCIVRGMLVIGLYRNRGHLGSTLPYVFTNPPPNTVVHPGDALFVLAHNQPSENLDARTHADKPRTSPHMQPSKSTRAGSAYYTATERARRK